MTSPKRPTTLAALSFAALLVFASVAYANVDFAESDVPTLFFIDKSDDHNRVDYGIRLDASCHPTSGSPMVVYWREFEGSSGGRVTHGLSIFEGPVYGVGSQRVTETHDGGATLEIDISAVSARVLTVHTSRGPSGCTAYATTSIGGTPARLDHVHLTLGSGFGSLRFADIYGTAVGGGAAVTEHVVH